MANAHLNRLNRSRRFGSGAFQSSNQFENKMISANDFTPERAQILMKVYEWYICILGITCQLNETSFQCGGWSGVARGHDRSMRCEGRGQYLAADGVSD